MKKDRFELEQRILDCWGITDDLDHIMEYILENDVSKDKVANMLLGLSELYKVKFEQTFGLFEDLIHNGEIS